MRAAVVALFLFVVTTAGADVDGGQWVRCLIAEADDAGGVRAVSCEGALLRLAEEGALEEEAPAGVGTRLVCGACAALCVLCAAFAAGLTLGLTSLDEFGLQVLCNRNPDAEMDVDGEVHAKLSARERLLRDQRCARMILPLVSGRFLGDSPRFSRFNPTNSHMLLVTMLLVNSMANEALPLFLDQLVPSWAAIILSVTVVLLFGEILPSAIFTGPHQLELAATLSPTVRVARMVLLPIAGPISLLLDVAVGSHKAEEDRREEMKAMAKTLQLHGLERDEVNMITGVLEMHSKTARDISMPLEQAKMLAHDEVLTEETVQELLRWGHSRVFVYRRDESDPSRRDDIVGVLLAKKLLGLDLQEGRRIDSIQDALKMPVMLNPDDNLLAVLDKFQAGLCHLAVVSATSTPGCEEACATIVEGGPLMFCSLEDVIEALLKEDIFDEADAEHGRIPVAPPVRTTSSFQTLLTRRSRSTSENAFPAWGLREPSAAKPQETKAQEGKSQVDAKADDAV